MMNEYQKVKLEQALRGLRHLYEQMLVPGTVTDTVSAAKYLLVPAIENIEKAKDTPYVPG